MGVGVQVGCVVFGESMARPGLAGEEKEGEKRDTCGHMKVTWLDK